MGRERRQLVLWSSSPHLPPLSLYCYLGLPAWFCFCEAVKGLKSSSDQLTPLPTFNASHHSGNRPSASSHHTGLLASTHLFQLHSSLLPINSELQPLVSIWLVLFLLPGSLFTHAFLANSCTSFDTQSDTLQLFLT